MGEEQWYELTIGFISSESVTATVCQKTIDEMFEVMRTDLQLYAFKCLAGDRTVIRLPRVDFVISKKLTRGDKPKNG